MSFFETQKDQTHTHTQNGKFFEVQRACRLQKSPKEKQLSALGYVLAMSRVVPLEVGGGEKGEQENQAMQN